MPTYRVRTTNPIAIILYLAVYCTLLVWSIYFTIMIASHVGAWPFG